VVALLWFNFYYGDLICWLLKENILMKIGSGLVLATPSMLSTALNPQQAILELTLRGPTKFAPKVALWQVTTNVPLNQFNIATSTIITQIVMQKTGEFALTPHFPGLESGAFHMGRVPSKNGIKATIYMQLESPYMFLI
jgi:hypothetical protein